MRRKFITLGKFLCNCPMSQYMYNKLKFEMHFKSNLDFVLLQVCNEGLAVEGIVGMPGIHKIQVIQTKATMP